LVFESIVVIIASSLLSFAGIPASAEGAFVYLPSFGHSFQVQIGSVDWASFLLLDFFYVFAVWTFITVRGDELQSARYLEIGTIGFIIMFLGNGVKVFAQIYVAATSGTLRSGFDAATLASMDAAGLVALFEPDFLAVSTTCLLFAKGISRNGEWSLGPTGARPIP